MTSVDMYCATAAATCNLENAYKGHTVLEYLTGEVPRTHRDPVTKQQLQDMVGDVDSEFLTQLQALLAETDTFGTDRP